MTSWLRFQFTFLLLFGSYPSLHKRNAQKFFQPIWLADYTYVVKENDYLLSEIVAMNLLSATRAYGNPVPVRLYAKADWCHSTHELNDFGFASLSYIRVPLSPWKFVMLFYCHQRYSRRDYVCSCAFCGFLACIFSYRCKDEILRPLWLWPFAFGYAACQNLLKYFYSVQLCRNVRRGSSG